RQHRGLSGNAFTIHLPPACAIRRSSSSSHFDRVCAGRITGFYRLECAQNPQLIINAFLTLSAVTKWGRAEPGWGRPRPSFALEMPWQPSKFRPEMRGREAGPEAAIVPVRGFWAGKARRSAEI